MRKILNKVVIAVFAVICLLFITSKVEVKAVTVTNITFHYFRYDGNYTNYCAWYWSEDAAGKGVALQKDSGMYGYTMSAKVSITEAENDDRFGVIFVQKNSGVSKTTGLTSGDMNWSTQTDNIYFYVKDATSANVDVFYSDGDENVTLTEADATQARKNKFMYLSFSDQTTISYTATNPVSGVEVYKNGEKVSLANAPTGKSGTIKLTQNLDYSAEYYVKATIKGDAVDHADIAFNGVYSSKAFGDAFNYDGELGAIYTPEKTTFKLWAPISKNVELKLYHYGHPTKLGTEQYPGDDTPYQTAEMTKGDKGVWSVEVEGNLDGVYYTYQVVNSTGGNEVCDPYAKTTGLNGLRGMVVNFSASNEKLNPEGWATQTIPAGTSNNVDKILYETHVRDMTASSTWGGNPEWAGTFLGLSQRGTTYSNGGKTVTTGLDHLIEFGVTHVHILPVMDAEIINETLIHDEEYKQLEVDGIYNWDYMTRSFFALEGAYSTNPYDGYARMIEYKTMIEAMHNNGICLVMDVVYNHTASTGDSNFNLIIPKYYHRTSNGAFTNGSGCGNEMCSDRYMVRKLIVDSTTFFADEYKVDGYRFDLMALEDTDTMNEVYSKTSAINPNIIVYGEPWNGDGNVDGKGEGGVEYLDSGSYASARKGNLNMMPNVAAFSDVARKGIRGDNYDVNTSVMKGWTLNAGYYDEVVWSIMGGAGYHNSASSDYTAMSPNQLINYASCHDNNTLLDQIKVPTGWGYTNEKLKMAYSQCLGIVLTSEGVPFIEGGSEVGRTKQYKDPDTGKLVYSHNSYNLGDKINVINYQKKIDNYDYYMAVRSYVAVRKEHSAFRQTTYTGVQNVLSNQNSTLYYNNGQTIAYRLKDSKDTWNDIYVIHNNSAGTKSFSLPSGSWKVAASNNTTRTFNQKLSGSVSLKPNETLIVANSSADLTLTLNNIDISEPTVTTYTVSFKANGGTGSMDTQTIEAGEYTLPQNSFTAPENKEFAGWDVAGTVKQAGEKITLAANTEIKATWKDKAAEQGGSQEQGGTTTPTEFTLSFAANGGTGSMTAVKAAGEYTLPQNGFTAPENKTFDGWTVNGTLKQPGEKITVSADTTITAHWKYNVVEVDDYSVTEQGGTIVRPRQSTDEKHIAYVVSILSNKTQDAEDALVKLVGQAKVDALAKFNEFKAGTYSDTVSAYNAYQAAYQIYLLAVDGNAFAQSILCMTNDVLADLYYELYRQR